MDASTTATSSSLSVLVVDDNDVDRERVRRALDGSYRVLEAATAEAARAVAREQRPACILLDLRLPQVEGFELLRELVEREHLVVLITGVGTESVAVEATEAGAADYVVKGEWTDAALRRTVRVALTQRALRERLDRVESHSAALLRALPDRLIRFTSAGLLHERISGRRPLGPESADAPPVHLMDRYGPEVASRLLELAARSRTKESVERLEFEVRDEVGERIIEARIVPSGDGVYLLLERDMTEQRRLERHVRTTLHLESLGNLARGVGHDFNNLLSVIFSYLHLIEQSAEDPDAVREDAAVIREAARRASDLTKQLMTFGRKQAQELQKIDVNELVEETVPLLRTMLPSACDLRLELADEPLPIHADASQIEQVLMNLVLNARDATSESGQITVRTKRSAPVAPVERRAERDANDPPHDCVMIAVEDDGPGMTPETAERIFEPFFTTKGQSGTGLGLAITYGVVKQSGGSIVVDTALGEGTKMTVCLPFAGPSSTHRQDDVFSSVFVLSDGTERGQALLDSLDRLDLRAVPVPSETSLRRRLESTSLEDERLVVIDRAGMSQDAAIIHRALELGCAVVARVNDATAQFLAWPGAGELQTVPSDSSPEDLASAAQELAARSGRKPRPSRTIRAVTNEEVS